MARGHELLPWAQSAADLLGEQLPDGHMAYPIAVVLVPRQCGKTTLAFDLALGRCLSTPDYRVAYTSQTGHATSERFRESFDMLGTLRGQIRVRRSQGTERLTCENTGSYVKAFPPIDGSLRGSALDLVVCDEAQEHDEDLGAALDRTIMPTFNTRPRRQLLLMGTAGNVRSGWMRRYYDRAREGAPGHALIDYGADDAASPADESVWWATHPGLAAGLTDPEALRTALAVIGADQFRREYLNIWSADDGGRSQPIPLTLWEQLAGEVRHAPDRVLAFDVSPDREQAAIAGASRHPDGLVVCDLLWQGHGRDLADEIVRLCGHVSDGGRVGKVLGAPSQADVARRLRTADVLADCVGGAEYAGACQRLADLVQGARIRHAGREAVSVALSAATRAWRGDAWVWSGRRSGTDITPIVALTLAVYGADRASVPVLV